MGSNISSTTSSMDDDRLTWNPMLLRICEYLDQPSVVRCMRVNTRFNEIITRNDSKMQRPEARVFISCCGRLGAEPENNTIFVAVHTYPFIDSHSRIQVKIQPKSVVAQKSSEKSCKYLFALQKYQEARSESATQLSKSSCEHILSSANYNPLIALKDTLSHIFSSVVLSRIELEDRNDQDVYNTEFSDDHLRCIRDCLRERDANTSKMISEVQLFYSNPLHWEIIAAADMDTATIRCNGSILNDNAILGLRTDTRTKLTFQRFPFPLPTFPLLQLPWLESLHGLELLLQEWLIGRRDIISIRFDAGDRLIYPRGEERLLELFPDARVILGCEQPVLGHLYRNSDQPRLYFTLHSHSYEFQCEE